MLYCCIATQDTASLVQRNGGKPPLTYQSFIKLVDKLGDPPSPVASAPAQIPPPWANALGADVAATRVPTLEEVGFQEKPTTMFKVGG